MMKRHERKLVFLLVLCMVFGIKENTYAAEVSSVAEITAPEETESVSDNSAGNPVALLSSDPDNSGGGYLDNYETQTVFEIDSLEDWNAIAAATDKDFAGKTVKLTADIDAKNANLPTLFTSFAGTFDGNDKTIKNAKASQADCRRNESRSVFLQGDT